MTIHLAIRDATVRYGGRAALDAVTAEVERHEVVAVLGPSGSGKSTLLRAVAGLQPLDEGRIELDGQDLAGVPPHRRGVGLMFQDHALFPHRDVAGNIAFGLRMQGWGRPEIDRRVGELLELVRLAGTGHRSVRTLSGGEQQRVALARALAPSPKALLLDEPLGALDRSLRDELVVELRALFTQLGSTVVAVTHDRDEAFALADRIVVMDAGRVLRAGAPGALWADPGSRRVAELLGMANLVDVDVRGGEAATPWGPVPLPGAPDGPHTLLVRAADARLAPTGPIHGTVTASTFQGDRVLIEVTAPGAPPLEAHVDPSGAPEVGAAVRLALPAVQVLSR